jgi:hypothetical protein
MIHDPSAWTTQAIAAFEQLAQRLEAGRSWPCSGAANAVKFADL